MRIYPFNYPVVLTTDIYVKYGGKTGTFTQEQLDIAFQVAEQQTVNYIGTFLLPCIVTGTYTAVPTKTQRIITDYGYVSQLISVTVKSQSHPISSGAMGCCKIDDLDGCGFIYDDTFGYIDVHQLESRCGCCGEFRRPYQYQIVYEAGLPTGVATQPGMLAAMTLAATITLNELYPGVIGMNEGVGDVGIQEFESFSYHERRTAHALRRTAFGGSAMASKVANLIDSCVRKARRSLRM